MPVTGRTSSTARARAARNESPRAKALTSLQSALVRAKKAGELPKAKLSFVDLWLLSSRNAREERRVDGVDVSLLSTTPAFARSLEGMLRFEVEDAIVLHDPEGLFRALKRTARERREELRAHVVEASVLVMDALAAASKRARPPLALAALRELVRRGASLAVYARYGWRVPRLRHFHEAFPRSLAAASSAPSGCP